MAKKSNRQAFPFRDAETKTEIWLVTNPVNNRVKGTTKLKLKKYSKELRKHVVFEQKKRPANVQQGGKKKR